ncbi:MAG TPA: hypothetical protein VK709_12505 [Candidatus Saccharimonadales bacterium]|jgi:hypothetical protein|nr:hypothetical protein [Candidatus Saccharimonadales bacterium]
MNFVPIIFAPVSWRQAKGIDESVLGGTAIDSTFLKKTSKGSQPNTGSLQQTQWQFTRFINPPFSLKEQKGIRGK